MEVWQSMGADLKRLPVNILNISVYYQLVSKTGIGGYSRSLVVDESPIRHEVAP